MNKIDQQIKKIKESGKIGLMTHVVVGYPSLEMTERVVLAMVEAGSDFIELQIPFSDPLVDGPAIMQANDVSIKNGVTTEDCFKLIEKLSKNITTPLLLMGYYNSLFTIGIDSFCGRAKKVGASGLIFSDIPPEEESQESYITTAEKYSLYPIRLISPASTEERLKINAKYAKGFVYCISRLGTTSARAEIDPQLSSYLKKVKKHFYTPLAVGFGISKPDHVKSLKGQADIVIVGSAVINILEEKNLSNNEKLTKIKNFVNKLKNV